jgi:hypothetical protein
MRQTVTSLLGACIIIIGTFATTSQAYGQASGGAQNQIVPVDDVADGIRMIKLLFLVSLSYVISVRY